MLRFLPAVLLIVPLAAPASATTLNTIAFGTGGSGATPCAPPGSGMSLESGVPFEQTFITANSDGSCTQTSSARAGGGSVGVASNVQAAGSPLSPSNSNPRVDISAMAEMDLLLGVPANWSGAFIPLQLTAHIDGTLDASLTTANTIFGRGATAALVATITLEGFTSPGQLFPTATGATRRFEARAGNIGLPPSATLDIDDTLTTGTLVVDPARPITVTFRLAGETVSGIFADSAMSTGIDAFNSLGFVPGVPIFNLPAGFTLNAPEFGIVDNRFAGDDPPAEVPLPAGAVLLLSGVALMAGWQRLRGA